mmetsp:Transcript_1151/g.3948  ORF Transcript_1151/g.3948 Transcript_1151/m.3948 type:complete len:93 (+) Transcript_1151:1937-2215(+)
MLLKKDMSVNPRLLLKQIEGAPVESPRPPLSISISLLHHSPLLEQYFLPSPIAFTKKNLPRSHHYHHHQTVGKKPLSVHSRQKRIFFIYCLC